MSGISYRTYLALAGRNSCRSKQHIVIQVWLPMLVGTKFNRNETPLVDRVVRKQAKWR